MHLNLRRERAGPAREQLKQWLDREQPRHPPKSPIGVAIRYALGHWDELGRFVHDPRIPLDNNASERALRRVALGRKNFLFVGHVDAGKNLAGLYSFVATCEARSINPFAYLADVIARIDENPASKLDDLLPASWTPVARFKTSPVDRLHGAARIAEDPEPMRIDERLALEMFEPGLQHVDRVRTDEVCVEPHAWTFC